jgi:xanthine dehydrogenase molybdopterin-binding subunit B
MANQLRTRLHLCAARATLAQSQAQSGEVAVDDITSRETVKQFKWVGTRPVRPDGVPKVTGLAQYGADLAMPGMLVGRILRSPHAHARIRSIDTSKAAALPGVKAVVTSADFPEQKFEYVGPERVAQNFWHMTRNIMAREKTLYEGHAVAAVAATSKAIADEALSLIAVTYEVLPRAALHQRPEIHVAFAPREPLARRQEGVEGVVGGQQTAQHGLRSQGELRPAVELRTRRLGAALLRELARKPQVAAAPTL